MKEIKLQNSNKVAIVDDEDYDYLNQWQWWVRKNRSIYYALRRICINGKIVNIHMHREITHSPNGFLVDHKDHNGLNNLKDNLRICTKSQNSSNRRSNKNSISCYLGVTICTRNYKEKVYHYALAVICHNNKNIYLGSYKSEVDAARAYDKAAIEYHGEFANLNFPPLVTKNH